MPPYLTVFPASVDVREAIGEGTIEQFLNLDRFLVNLWESLSIRPSITRPLSREKSGISDCIESLVPEMAGRGMIEHYIP